MNANKRGLLALVMLLVVLGGGIGIGIALGRTWLAPKGPASSLESADQRVGRLVERFRRKLKLDAAQAKTIAAALTRSHAERAAVRQRIAPDLRAAREKLRAEINAALTEAQRAKYAEMVARYDAKRKAAGRAH